MRSHSPTLRLLILALSLALSACEVDWVGQTPEELGDGINDAPVLVLDSPTEGATFGVDVAVPFNGRVTDDGTPDSVYLTITSNLDGLIDRPEVTADGSFTTSGLLSAGTHALTVTATDAGGLQASVSRTILIDDGGGVGPLLTVALDPASPIGALETACVTTAEDPDGLPVTVVSSWQVNGSDAGPADVPISGLVRGDSLSCVVTATSAAGETNETLTATVGNSAPVVSAVQLEGGPPTELSTLVCSATTSDYDGDPITRTTAWVVNGAVILEGPSSLTGEHFDRDDEVVCRVTPRDSTDEGEPRDSNVQTVLNTAPTAPAGVHVSPGTALLGAGLTCVVDVPGTDVDTHDPLVHEFRWTVDGVESASDTAAVFGTGDATEGAVISCAARTSDGDLSSGWVAADNSATLTQGLAGTYDTTDAWTTIAGTTSGDRLGRALADVGDLDGDGVPELVLGANQHDSNRGQAFLFDGATVAAGGSLDDGDALFDWRGPAQGALFAGGEAIVAVGDATGGGAPDLLIAAYRADGIGAAYLFAGEDQGGWAGGAAEDEAAVIFRGDAAGDDFGLDVGAADVDGDGLSDIFLGAPYNDDNGESAGVVSVVLGAGLPASGDVATGDADHAWTGESAGDLVGYGAMEALGDIDGDGYLDVSVGARDAGSSAAGALYILSGGDFVSGGLPAGGELASAAAWRVDGQAAGDQLSMSAAGLGDLDGDGADEFAVGARYGDIQTVDAGGVYVFFGGGLAVTTSAASADASFGSEANSDLAGKNLAAGDVDGDGFPDLLVSSHYHDGNGSNAGTAWLLLGGGWASWTPGATLAGASQARFQGNSNNDYLSGMSDLVDLDADGFDELIIGADGDNSQAGTVYVFAQP